MERSNDLLIQRPPKHLKPLKQRRDGILMKIKDDIISGLRVLFAPIPKLPCPQLCSFEARDEKYAHMEIKMQISVTAFSPGSQKEREAAKNRKAKPQSHKGFDGEGRVNKIWKPGDPGSICLDSSPPGCASPVASLRRTPDLCP